MSELLDDAFVPALNNYKSFKFRTLAFWTVFLMIALLFRLLHFPFGQIMFLVASAGMIAHAWSMWIRLRGSNLFNNIVSMAGVAWIAILLWGYFYTPKGIASFLNYWGVFFVLNVTIDHFRYRRN
jgi:hypothetical protein